MNIKIVVGLVAVIVAGGTIVLTQSASTTGGSQMTASGVPVPETFTGSMEGLFTLGVDATCTFERADEVGTVSGVVYVSGDRMRGNFNLDTDQGQFDGGIIRDGAYVYTWADTPFGTFASKIAYEDLAVETEYTETPVSFTEAIDYRCTGWNVDTSVFELPQGVDFVEIDSEAMLGSDIEVTCSACDSINNSTAREQCRLALECNQ